MEIDHPGVSGSVRFQPEPTLLASMSSALEQVAEEEQPGLSPEMPEGSEKIPRPWWAFYRQDVNRDGRSEILVTGGVEPSFLYALLVPVDDGSWRLAVCRPYHEFLGARIRGSEVLLFGGSDGYGVATPTVVIDRIDFSETTNTLSTLTLDLPLQSWTEAGRSIFPTWSHGAVPCHTTSVAGLRNAPKQDDTPKSVWGPITRGNIELWLAAASTGWCLAEKEISGDRWTLAMFRGERQGFSDLEELERTPPIASHSKPLTDTQELVAGWIRSDEVSRR